MAEGRLHGNGTLHARLRHRTTAAHARWRRHGSTDEQTGGVLTLVAGACVTSEYVRLPVRCRGKSLLREIYTTNVFPRKHQGEQNDGFLPLFVVVKMGREHSFCTTRSRILEFLLTV